MASGGHHRQRHGRDGDGDAAGSEVAQMFNAIDTQHEQPGTENAAVPGRMMIITPMKAGECREPAPPTDRLAEQDRRRGRYGERPELTDAGRVADGHHGKGRKKRDRRAALAEHAPSEQTPRRAFAAGAVRLAHMRRR